MSAWFAVEREGGSVDRRALLGLRSADPQGPHSHPRPGILDGCTGCGTCVAVCPSGALAAAQLPTTVVLSVDPLACTGCGECVERCPEKILAPAATLPGCDDPVRLARIRIERCNRCRVHLHPGETGMCTSCSSRRSLMDDLWTQLG
ncbi:4Fe-4S binding protein [Gephyromycinifex aptenodytis]|uniref:4Fe-4S binding protein n=1 Tax=Gephyromycinifex aptenodytis TaxID=2716227 RepID=UPI001447D7D4|nr:4Fe-4S dicluster domain-containing protein [Gephyromycinifex aptenodytis]